jgi:hypothetical protein
MVPARPSFIGSPGWVRSRAWIWLFSSTESTTACAGGRRSGDPFCVYVCDRLVLPGLHGRLAGLADGSLSLDRETRAYVRASLGFRFVPVPDGATALALEREVRGGSLRAGRPLLNPL